MLAAETNASTSVEWNAHVLRHLHTNFSAVGVNSLPSVVAAGHAAYFEYQAQLQRDLVPSRTWKVVVPHGLAAAAGTQAEDNTQASLGQQLAPLVPLSPPSPGRDPAARPPSVQRSAMPKGAHFAEVVNGHGMLFLDTRYARSLIEGLKPGRPDLAAGDPAAQLAHQVQGADEEMEPLVLPTSHKRLNESVWSKSQLALLSSRQLQWAAEQLRKWEHDPLIGNVLVFTQVPLVFFSRLAAQITDIAEHDKYPGHPRLQASTDALLAALASSSKVRFALAGDVHVFSHSSVILRKPVALPPSRGVAAEAKVEVGADGGFNSVEEPPLDEWDHPSTGSQHASQRSRANDDGVFSWTGVLSDPVGQIQRLLADSSVDAAIGGGGSADTDGPDFEHSQVITQLVASGFTYFSSTTVRPKIASFFSIPLYWGGVNTADKQLRWHSVFEGNNYIVLSLRAGGQGKCSADVQAASAWDTAHASRGGARAVLGSLFRRDTYATWRRLHGCHRQNPLMLSNDPQHTGSPLFSEGQNTADAEAYWAQAKGVPPLPPATGAMAVIESLGRWLTAGDDMWDAERDTAVFPGRDLNPSAELFDWYWYDGGRVEVQDKCMPLEWRAELRPLPHKAAARFVHWLFDRAWGVIVAPLLAVLLLVLWGGILATRIVLRLCCGVPCGCCCFDGCRKSAAY